MVRSIKRIGDARLIQSVMTMAPLRVSLCGGGTDLPSYFLLENGAVTSIAINKYTYVHIKRHDPLFQERFRISYSDTEHCNSVSEIENDIIRSCLEYLKFDEPLHISTSSDLPSRSGLGSSSSLMVALLQALHTINHREVSPIQLAEEAFEIENTVLKSQVGKQDQYACAFGGMNHFSFYSTGRVKCEPIVVSKEIEEFFRDALLLWTEIERPANEILSEQANQVEEKLDYYRQLKEFADQVADCLTNSRAELSQISRIVRKSWDLKQKLSDGIVNRKVDSISKHLDDLGLKGHKLLGAGAGGFFLVLEVGRQSKELQKLYKTLEFKIDQKGSRVVHILR